MISERSAASKSNKEALTLCTTMLDEISTLAPEKFGDSVPDLGELARAVREKLESIPADKPPEEEKSESSSPDSSAPQVSAADVSSPEAARAAIPMLAEQRVKVAGVMVSVLPMKLMVYSLSAVSEPWLMA